VSITSLTDHSVPETPLKEATSALLGLSRALSTFTLVVIHPGVFDGKKVCGLAVARLVRANVPSTRGRISEMIGLIGKREEHFDSFFHGGSGWSS